MLAPCVTLQLLPVSSPTHILQTGRMNSDLSVWHNLLVICPSVRALLGMMEQKHILLAVTEYRNYFLEDVVNRGNASMPDLVSHCTRDCSNREIDSWRIK